MVPQDGERTHDIAAHLLPEEVADHTIGLLAQLGQTADTVAARLAELGITGHRDEADRCPIANYLTRAEPALRAVAVLDRVIDLYTHTGTGTSVAVPDAVADFVTGFDLGRYPHLIDTSAQPNNLADPGTTIREEDRS